MKEKGKRLSKKIIFAIVCAAVIGSILIAFAGLQIAFMVADEIECWRPDYDKKDISVILDKKELTPGDYAELYKQTGVTKIGIDRALENGEAGKQKILKIQNDFFAEHNVINEYFAPLVCQDKTDRRMSYIYLEDGDIIVSSSTHISSWRAGHAGLVTNAAGNSILQASAIGESSDYGTMADFNDRVNFMILSPKVDAEVKAQVVDYAKTNLVGKIYDPTVGVFSKKTDIGKTQCAHLVWAAYYQFGIDLDANGGLVVTPWNLANSPYVDVVQVFGIDLVKLWK